MAVRAYNWIRLASILLAASFALAVQGRPTDLSPSGTAGNPVALLTTDQKDYLYTKTFEERREIAGSGQQATLFCYGSPLTLSWTGTTGECTVEVRRISGKDASAAVAETATAREQPVVWSGRTRSTSVEVCNLEAGAEYEWTVTCGGESASAKFTTEDTAPRLIKTGLIRNLRDLGVRTGTLGDRQYRIRQNLLFRGGAADDPKATGSQPAYLIESESDRDFFYNVVGLKNEVDLRNPNDPSDITYAARQSGKYKFDLTGEHVTYNNFSIANNALPTSGNIVSVWRLLTTPAKLPAYFHCKSGRDRTGIVAAVLLAVLGVSRDDIVLDFQTTSDKDNWTTYGFSTILDSSLADYRKGANLSLAENASAYLQDCGITAEEIETFRAAMLEGYAQEDPPEDPEEPLPAYDMSGVTFTNQTVTYNGQKQTGAVGGTLPAGVSVSYEGGGTNVGKYTVTAHFTGDADHAPIADREATLTINRAGITSATAATAEYTGAIITPVLTVKAGSLDVSATTGYTVDSWRRAPGTTGGTVRKDVGKYYATVTGKGNFNGSRVVYFEIVAAGEWAEISRKLGAETEFQNEPAIEFAAADAVPADGGLTMRVTVAVRDGGAVKAVDPNKVKAYFEATDDLSDWSNGMIGFEITSATRNGDGTLEFTVKLTDATPRTFVRIRVQ